MECGGNRFPHHDTGRFLNFGFRGEGKLHASAMMAAFMILRALVTSGARRSRRGMGRTGLHRNAWMPEAAVMCEGIPIPCDYGQHYAAPKEQPRYGG